MDVIIMKYDIGYDIVL